MPRPRSTTRKPPTTRRPAAGAPQSTVYPVCNRCRKVIEGASVGAELCMTCSSPIVLRVAQQAEPVAVIALAPSTSDDPPVERPAPRVGDVVLFRIGIDDDETRPAMVVRITDFGCDLKVELVPGEPVPGGLGVDRMNGFVHSALAGGRPGEWRAR